MLYFILLSIFVFTTQSSFSQSESSDNDGTGLSIGLKAGANVSNVYDVEGEEFQADPKLGFAGGVFITLPITRFLGFQPEILFSQKGYKGAGSVLGSDYTFSRTSNYIDVPLLLSLRTGKYLSLLVGPQYSFLVSQKYTFNSALVDVSEDEQFDNKNLKKNTLCLTGGLDLNINKIVLGARLGWDLLNNQVDGTSAAPRYKNMWYQATIGYRF